MTTETTAPAERAKQISDRLLEIGPYPESNDAATALKVGRYLAVRAQVIWRQQISTGAVTDHPRIDLMTVLFAASHALFAAHDRDRAHADLVAREIWGAWEDGGGVGDLVRRMLGSETCAEVGALAEELTALEAADRVERADELAKLRQGAKELGHITARLYRVMEAARIESHQGNTYEAVQWILNALPPPVDEGDGLGWDGKESAQHWFDRVEAADKDAEAAAR